MRDTDPKANVMTEQALFLHQCFDSGSHFERHKNSLQRRDQGQQGARCEVNFWFCCDT
jgi:hypothetical protein